MQMRESLTYADVLIEPRYSDINSRDEIDIRSPYLGGLRIPLVSAPMDYVTGFQMAAEMASLNAYGVVNRFGTEGTPLHHWFDFSLAIGTKDWDTTAARIETYATGGSVCIDVAHGYHKNVIETIIHIKDNFPHHKIIVGNVATYSGFATLATYGVDAIRVGIGSGSACSTRENTGIGVPQLTAIMDCAKAKQNFPNVALIADGGIQSPGDISKAIVGGADAVMLGKMLAGHDESPGDLIEIDYQWYKPYRGQSLLGSNGYRKAPEGVAGFVPAKGPVKETVESLMHYLRSSFSYVGARNIEEFRQLAEFIKVSSATFQESKTRI